MNLGKVWQWVRTGDRGFLGAVALVVVVALGVTALVANDGGGTKAAAAGQLVTPGGGGNDIARTTPRDLADNQIKPMSSIPPEDVPSQLPLRSKRQVRLPYVLKDGVKVFTLDAEPVRWELTKGTWITAWGYNGQVPGPEIWVNQGDKVRINFTNRLPEPTTIHWHGIDVPNTMDGVPDFTQDPIMPGQTFAYQFTAKPSGTFWYHSHFDGARQLDMGLAGAFIILGKNEPKYDRDYVELIQDWIRLPDGRNGWEGVDHAGHSQAEYNWFTLNGKSFPDTEDIDVRKGDHVRVRIIDASSAVHDMHQHGERYRVIAKDGAMLPKPYLADTIQLGTGERYDYDFVADNPGDWMFHCHIPNHMTNDAVDPGGLITFVHYAGYQNDYEKAKYAK